MKQFTIRLDDALQQQFDRLKEHLGLKNDAEVVRLLIKRSATKELEEATA